MDSGSVVVVGSNVWLHLKLRIMEVERWSDGGRRTEDSQHQSTGSSVIRRRAASVFHQANVLKMGVGG